MQHQAQVQMHHVPKFIAHVDGQLQEVKPKAALMVQPAVMAKMVFPVAHANGRPLAAIQAHKVPLMKWAHDNTYEGVQALRNMVNHVKSEHGHLMHAQPVHVPGALNVQAQVLHPLFI